MKKIFITIRLTFFALLLLSTPVYSGGMIDKSEITNAYDPSGTWNAEIEVPGRTVDLIITISKNDEGEFEVSIEDTDEGETKELEDVSFDEEDKVMTGEVDADGTTIDIELKFDGDSLEGTVSAEGMEMELSGERETN